MLHHFLSNVFGPPLSICGPPPYHMLCFLLSETILVTCFKLKSQDLDFSGNLQINLIRFLKFFFFLFHLSCFYAFQTPKFHVVPQWSSIAWLDGQYLLNGNHNMWVYFIYIFPWIYWMFAKPSLLFSFLNSEISSCIYSPRQHTLSYQSLFRHCKTTELCLGHVLRYAL